MTPGSIWPPLRRGQPGGTKRDAEAAVGPFMNSGGPGFRQRIWRGAGLGRLWVLALAVAGMSVRGAEAAPVAYRILLRTEPAPEARAFRPDQALGAAIDGAEAGDIDRNLTRGNVAAMKRAGLRPLSYRLRTELGIEVWHWNPAGKWSDPVHQEGYWTSSDAPGPPIRLSWGYRLPRRGDTVDNANDDDFSRLTDGDLGTFWKSNPYLDPSVLRDGHEHPQWLLVRLDHANLINMAIIDWAEPHAVRFEVQYREELDGEGVEGRWVTFPGGAVTRAAGGRMRLRLSDAPIRTRFLRILMHEGSRTAAPGATDWRDSLGVAVREVSFGASDASGEFHDVVVHAASHTGQTFTHVSSTDPWHRARDRNPDLEQAGLDRIFTSGLGFGLPVMIPTGLLYDTPENEAAELRYLAQRGYPVRQIELGEEPDGQFASPEDYGALYLAAIDHLRSVAPGAVFGGPSLQSAFTDLYLQTGAGSWNRAFVDYLKQRGRLADLGFVSFEFYPFDDICGDIPWMLKGQGDLLAGAMRRLDSDGVPAPVPRIISEYGFSAYSGRAMSELPSALLMAGIAGQWLSLGGDTAYMFGYPPNQPINQHQPCAGYGNMMLYMADANGRAATPMPSYHAARLLTGKWLQPGGGLHHMLEAHVEGDPDTAVAAYAVRRPDGRIGVLAINRSPDRSVRLALVRADPGQPQSPLQGPADIFTFGPDQYAWRDAGPDSRPRFSHPPRRARLPAGPLVLTLPPYAVQVAVTPGG